DVARADAIRASLDAAKASGQLKSKFVANMSHEIKTPLNAIVGFTDLLTSSEDPQEKQMYVHFITENNNSHLELIDSILNIPASEGKGVKLNKENFDLNDMMEEIAYATRLSVDSDKIQVTFRKPYDSMVIYQDRNKLKEAVSNLSGNSAKYTKQGNIILDYNLDAAGWLTITVSDTGIGITDEDQKNIFRRYVRVGETDAEGHGLGLSIIQQIISAMGGVVGVRSKLGEGSTFWIKIKKEVEQ
ncbi:MAG: HAMP domain-containing sensor histidine kinase, partial [Bacteroidales bacterium]